MKKKRYKYSFTRKRYTKGGVDSSIMALISVVLFAGGALSSLAMKGKGGLFLGAIGLAAIGISVYGFLLGMKSFSEKDRDLLFSKVGSVSNGVLMMVWLALFLTGIG